MVLPNDNRSKSMKTIFLILFLLANPRPSESFIVTAITTVFTAAYSLYGLFNDADDAVRKWTPQQTIGDVMDAVDGVSKKIDNIELNLSNKLDEAVDKLLISLPLLDRIDTAMKDLADYIIDIDTLYETFEYYVEERENLDNETLMNYAKSVGGTDSDDLIPLLEKLNKLIAPTRTSGFRESLVDLLNQNSKEHTVIKCNNGAPHETLLSDIYAAVMMTEMRGVLMTGFGYWALTFLGTNSYQAELRIARKRMLRRIASYKQKFEANDPFLGNEIYRCDVHAEERTDDLEPYFALKNLRMSYVINELELLGNCSIHCDAITEPIVHHSCNNRSEGCDDQHYCRGRLAHCKQSQDLIVTLNPEDDPFPIYTNVEGIEVIYLYDGLDKDQLQILGNRDKNRNSCSTCVCDCVHEDPKLPGMHYVSFREAVSDIDNNKVVTGLRLVYSDTCVHIVIQEGLALPRGEIHQNSTTWETIELQGPEDTISVHDGDVFTSETVREKNDLVEGEDYGLLTADIGAIFLDDVQVPKDYIVTDNARLSFSKPGTTPRGLQLEVRATPYDFLTGQVILDENSPSYWLSGEDMKGVYPEYNRERLEYPLSRNPIPYDEAMKIPRTVRGGRNYYYRIQPTRAGSDGGQKTLPLLDSLKNFGTPPFALSALGFFFKSAEDWGPGVVSNRLTLLDPIKYLNLDVSLVF